MAEPELLPCPFCGAVDTLYTRDDPNFIGCGIRCSKCGALGPEAPTAAEATSAWNRRAARPLDAETVERRRIYIDCEFNGWMGELLSFAMVADDGAEFYSVLPEPRTWDAWCFDNVFPVLNKKPVASFDDFRLAFLEFLRGYRNPIIVADWPADLYYFNKVLLGAGHENSVLIPCGMELVSCDYDSAIPHNALEDARAIARQLSPASQGDDT